MTYSPDPIEQLNDLRESGYGTTAVDPQPCINSPRPDMVSIVKPYKVCMFSDPSSANFHGSMGIMTADWLSGTKNAKWKAWAYKWYIKALQ
jgi:hypothetical protein